LKITNIQNIEERLALFGVVYLKQNLH